MTPTLAQLATLPERYQTIARCVERGCQCDDRAGVILYDGDDREAAEAATEEAPRGYAVEVETLDSGPCCHGNTAECNA